MCNKILNNLTSFVEKNSPSNIKNSELEDFYKNNFSFKLNDNLVNGLNQNKINQKNNLSEDFKNNKYDLFKFNKKKICEFLYMNYPILLESILVRSLSNGDDFTVFLSKNNLNLYLNGNNERNNLAFDAGEFIIQPLDYFDNMKIKINTNFENYIDPNYINNLHKIFFSKLNIISVKSYGKGFIFLTDKGQIFYVNDKFCKNLVESLPSPINLNNIKFSQIECGKNFCIFLSTTGVLYSQGDNKCGQLGQGDFNERKTICEIPNIKDAGIKTVQFSCGFEHVVIRSSNNKIFTWGNVK